jgi:hypothetical protein
MRRTGGALKRALCAALARLVAGLARRYRPLRPVPQARPAQGPSRPAPLAPLKVKTPIRGRDRLVPIKHNLWQRAAREAGRRAGRRTSSVTCPYSLSPSECRRWSRPPPPSLPYKLDTSRPSLRTNWTRWSRPARRVPPVSHASPPSSDALQPFSCFRPQPPSVVYRVVERGAGCIPGRKMGRGAGPRAAPQPRGRAPRHVVRPRRRRDPHRARTGALSRGGPASEPPPSPRGALRFLHHILGLHGE